MLHGRSPSRTPVNRTRSQAAPGDPAQPTVMPAVQGVGQVSASPVSPPEQTSPLPYPGGRGCWTRGWAPHGKMLHHQVLPRSALRILQTSRSALSQTPAGGSLGTPEGSAHCYPGGISESAPLCLLYPSLVHADTEQTAVKVWPALCVVWSLQR